MLYNNYYVRDFQSNIFLYVSNNNYYNTNLGGKTMSNYKWVKMSDHYAELRKEDFSSVPSFEVKEIDPILMEKLEENGIVSCLEGDGCFESCKYRLSAIKTKLITITAPLYECDLNSGEFVLLSESYTDEAIDPDEYERVRETYLRCTEEVASEQAKIFEEQFMEKSLDDGISSFITISSDPYNEPDYFYEQYIPEGYIKVCEKNLLFTRTRHEVVFIKKMDAEGQVVTIKVNYCYKGLVIGKNGENIKRIAKLINAKRINVI